MNKYYGFVFHTVCLLQILIFSTLPTLGMDKEEFGGSDNSLSSRIITAEQPREEFYVFGMGQGNSQLAIYEGQKFAVLYDCGSSSLQKHPKYVDRSKENQEITIINTLYTKNENYSYFETSIGKKMDEEKQSPSRNTLESNYNLNSVLEGLGKLDIGVTNSASNEAKISTKQAEISRIQLEEFIKQTIKNLSINHLFIFLSHPDKDHINYINEKTIPTEAASGDLKVTAFLCGDWSKDTEEIRQVKKIFSVRKNTGYFYPLNILLDKQRFRGSLANLLEKISLDTNYYERFGAGVREHFKDFDENFMKESGEKIFIESMNHNTQNDNDESPIISFKMPNIGMRFICTGDIGERDNKESNILLNLFTAKGEIYKQDDRLLTALILPHHGSNNNISSHLGHLFNPDLLIISSGNGKQYGHPDIRLIKEYYFLEKTSRFLNCYYSGGFPNLLLAFEGKEQASTKGLMVYNPSTPPIICTNILGSLRFDHKGIYSSYAPVIKLKDTEYFIDLLKESENLNSLTILNEEFDYIVKDVADNIYLKVLINKDKISYYLLKMI